MAWLEKFDLFLFDFDGLLVNTEEIHYQAYIRMCAKRGFKLDWDFNRYCSIAHYSSEGLREHLYKQFEDLHSQEPNWEVLYAEKKKAFIELIQEGAVHLMPGAEKLLRKLQGLGKKRCVVTHSADELVKRIREQNPILDTIPIWVTREYYSNPKPHPECYITAINKFASKGDQIIGFEDTPRGIQALLGSRATPVIVCTTNYPEIPTFIEKGVQRFRTLDELMNH